MANKNPMFNASGCKDPTAYEAVKQVSGEENELNHMVHKLISLVKDLVDFSGFEVVGRIHIKHKRTGKEFR